MHPKEQELEREQILRYSARALGLVHDGYYSSLDGLKLRREGDGYTAWNVWWDPMRRSSDAMKILIELQPHVVINDEAVTLIVGEKLVVEKITDKINSGEALRLALANLASGRYFGII